MDSTAWGRFIEKNTEKGSRIGAQKNLATNTVNYRKMGFIDLSYMKEYHSSHKPHIGNEEQMNYLDENDSAEGNDTKLSIHQGAKVHPEHTTA